MYIAVQVLGNVSLHALLPHAAASAASMIAGLDREKGSC
jgi:hypothetical protein